MHWRRRCTEFLMATNTTTTGIMTKETKQTGTQLKTTQVTAGALAAVTAAVLGSKLGIAGTVSGAALASIITTVGNVVYQRSLERTKRSVDRVRSLAAARLTVSNPATPNLDSETTQRVVPDAAGTVTGQLPTELTQPVRRVGETTVWLRPGDRPTVVDQVAVDKRPTEPVAMSGQLSVSSSEPESKSARRGLRAVNWRSLNWKTIVVVVVGSLVVGVGAVLAFEAITGHSAWGGVPSTVQVFTGRQGGPQQGGTSGGSGNDETGTSTAPTPPTTPSPSPSSTPQNATPLPSTSPVPTTTVTPLLPTSLLQPPPTANSGNAP